MNGKKILECSSKGDKRFSAFYAHIDVFGKYDSIENHYQESKGFNNHIGNRSKKGLKPDFVIINNNKYPIKFLSPWYDLLWIKYLNKNKDLVKILSLYDDFNDIFKSKHCFNCQADTIRKYMFYKKELLNDVKELLEILKTLRKGS